MLRTNEGFSDMTADDVNGLLDCHSETLTEEELVQMTKSASEVEGELTEEEKEDEESGLTLANLHGLCAMGLAIQQRAHEIDDDMVRAVEFSNRIEAIIQTYKDILAQKKKQRQQLPITMFLVKKTHHNLRHRLLLLTHPLLLLLEVLRHMCQTES